MKAVFINPWSQDEENVRWSSDYQTRYWRNPYFGLVQLATYVRTLGHDVTILDGERDLLMEARGKPGLLLRQIKQKVDKLRPDVVGVTGASWRYPTANKILKALEPMGKKLGFRLVQGGHHAIACPEGCLNDHPGLDAVFNGFAELGLREYLGGAPKYDVPGVVYKDGTVLVHTVNRHIEDMDSLPVPDWKLLDVKFYTHPSVWVHRSMTTPVRNLDTIASRGCAYHCKFCASVKTKPVWNSVDYIIEYIKYIKRDYGVNSTIFQDTSLGNNRRFLVELCEKLISSGARRGLIWTANMRADQVTLWLARLMHRAGCRLVFVGFESASDRILQAMDKGTTSEDNARCAEALELAGMPYWASFIVGYPGETEEEMRASMGFAHSINPLAGWANEFFPSPGSPIFNELVREGRLSVPTTPEEWASISRIGQKGRVSDGAWSDMHHKTFRELADQFQGFMQEVTDSGVRRRLEFPS